MSMFTNLRDRVNKIRNDSAKLNQAQDRLYRVAADLVAELGNRPFDENDPRYVEANNAVIEAERSIPWVLR